MADTYDNQFSSDNVYGHALQLLTVVCQPEASVHLDVGCGFGRIAEPLVDTLNRIYVGIDADSDGLDSLKQRGFEAHHFRLSDYDANLAFFRGILQGRRLGSISIIDTMEHLYDPKGTIAALRALAGESAAPIVVSVPNIAHTDIAIKLLMGRFDYTDDGLLDHTHVNFFTETRLLSMMASAGWHANLAKNDVLRRNSDQHFPETLLPLNDGSALSRLLRNLRERADGLGSVNQLVRIFMCGPETGESDLTDRAEGFQPPFLSVIVRTDGRTQGSLRKTIASLSEQKSHNFNVVVVGSGLDIKRQISVEQVIEENRSWLGGRDRLVRVEHANGAAALNAGFADADGHYVVILNEGDTALDNWVEMFEQLAKDNAGTILANSYATGTDQQEHRQHDYSQPSKNSVFDEAGPPAGIDFFERLQAEIGASPCLAFPKSIYSDLGYRFDETAAGGEVWDFFRKTVILCGLSASQETVASDFPTSAADSAASLSDASAGLAATSNHQVQYLPPDLMPTGNVGTLHVADIQMRIYPNNRKANDAVQAQNAQLVGELDQLRQYGAKLEQALDELKAYSGSRDAAFATLSDNTEQLTYENLQLKTELQGLTDGLSELMLRVQAQQPVANLPAIDNKSHVESIKTAALLIDRQTGRASQLEAENSVLEEHIRIMTNTRSWRLTAPVRNIVKLVRRTVK